VIVRVGANWVMNMGKMISATERTVRDIFSSLYQFRIPQYQRPYSWDVTHVEQMLEDLSQAFENPRHQENSKEQNPYFLGSIVLIKGEGAAADVIDGQQRLTTLNIIMGVLRDLSPQSEQIKMQSFLHETGNKYQGTQPHFRLRLRDRDASFFEQHVQHLGSTKIAGPVTRSDDDVQDRIVRNRDTIRSYLETRSEKYRCDFFEFVAKHCFLVVVSASDQESAFRIFSTMNDRGLDLSVADILKAELIGQIASDNSLDVTRRWEELEARLGRKQFVRLFAHIRALSLYNKKEQSLQQDFRDIALDWDSAESCLTNLVFPCGEILERLQSEDFYSETVGREVNSSIRRLNRLESADWVPPAILWLSQHNSDVRSTTAFFSALRK
jgi:uncharacterized protein with ParB-like and HNH nuclease domain